MIRQLINSVLLMGFLAIFSADSMSYLFELNANIVCELNDVNDGDSNEEEVNKMESEAIVGISPFMEYNTIGNALFFNTYQFLLNNIHHLSIPTPPPEFSF